MQTILEHEGSTEMDIIMEEEFSNLIQGASETVDAPNVPGELDPDRWKIIRANFRQNGLMEANIDSFNSFAINAVKDIVRKNKCIEVKLENLLEKERESKCEHARFVFTEDPILERPTITEDGITRPMFVNEAIQRKMTYSGNLTCKGEYIKWPGTNREERTPQNLFLGKIPIMVRSAFCNTNFDNKNECSLNHGGCFYIKGQCKIVVTQESQATNVSEVYFQKGIWRCEVRSHKEMGNRPPFQISITHLKPPEIPGDPVPIRAHIPYIKKESKGIPVVVVFRALGVIRDSEILQCIGDLHDVSLKTAMMPSFEEAFGVKTQEEAKRYIEDYAMLGVSESRISNVDDILNNELFPHIYYGNNLLRKKAMYLGRMTRKMIKAMSGKIPPGDRDHYSNKRILTVGDLLDRLFRTTFRRVELDIENYIRMCMDNNKDFADGSAIRPTTLSKSVKYALTRGDWSMAKGMPGGGGTKVSLSQVMTSIQPQAAVAMTRRVNTPIGREGKQTKPRALDPSHFNIYCASETPEGEACGLIKNLATTVKISVDTPIEGIVILLNVLGMHEEPHNFGEAGEDAVVIINGICVGFVANATEMAQKLRKFRRSGNLPVDVSICDVPFENELKILTDKGRPCHPLLIVEDGKICFTKEHERMIDHCGHATSIYNYLLSCGVIEYLDTDELDCCRVAFFTKDVTEHPEIPYTHVEIHPSTMFGVCASAIPFPDCNQAPRNTYQSAMGKQAIGVPANNFDELFNTASYVLHYPQKPVARTKMWDSMGFQKLPAGQNARIGVLPWRGYGQEDAIIIRQGWADMGGLRASTFKTHFDDEHRQGPVSIDNFENPDPETLGMKDADYSKLGPDGIIKIGSSANPSTVLIGKTTPTVLKKSADLAENKIQRKCNSTIMRRHEHGIVNKTLLTSNMGRRSVYVRLSNDRIPQKGDKLSSMHGQKGVIGIVIPDEDFPFDPVTGQSIDIIVNTHGFPSRMTMGQQHEMIQSTIALMLGRDTVDASPFEREDSGLDPHKLSKESIDALAKHGCDRHGNCSLIDGITGEMIETPIFVGVCFFQRLKHMVSDKLHARNNGHVQVQTRQPLEGRMRGGGLRNGEMEQDVMHSHGASEFQRSRWFTQTDAFSVHVCDLCGSVAHAVPDKSTHFAKKSNSNIHGTQGQHVCDACINSSAISKVEICNTAKSFFQFIQALGIEPKIITEDY